MSTGRRRVGLGLLAVCSALLLVTSGVALAHGGESTETTATMTHHDAERTHETTEASHDGAHTGTAATHHGGEETHRTSDGHAHGGDGSAGSDHHGSGAESASGHGHDDHDDGGLLGGWLSSVGGLFLLGAVATTPAYRYLRSAEGVALTPVHLVGALLALFTAAVHLYLFFEHGTLTMLLAGLGFVGGVVLLFAGVARRYLYLAGIAFTLVQMALWVDAGMPHLASFGLLDKVVQAALVAVLGYLYVRDESGVRG